MNMQVQHQRQRQRIAVTIPVVLTTVLDSVEANIADLTEFGAMIVGGTLPRGTLFQLDYEGHSVYARVMWEEVDRMGVRFPFELTEGPLFDLLHQARGGRPLVSDYVAARHAAGKASAAGTPLGFGRAATGGPARFGRRF